MNIIPAVRAAGRLVPVVPACVVALLAAADCGASPSQAQAYVHYLRAQQAQMQGDWLDAARELEKTIATDPGAVMVRQELRQLYERLGRIDDAARQAREILKMRPDDPGALRTAALAAVGEKNLAEAATYYLELVKSPSTDDATIFALGGLLAETNRIPEAISLFEAYISSRGENAAARTNLGILFENINRLPEARKQLEKALALEPESSGAIIGLARVEERQGRFKEAIGLYERFLKNDPEEVWAWHRIGQIRAGLKQYPAAREAFNRAIAVRPDDVGSYFYLGLIAEEERDYGEAREKFKKALQVNPDAVDALLHLGFVDSLEDKPDRAEKWYAAACARVPGDPDAWYMRGLNAQQRSLSRDAEGYFLKALALDPKNAKIFLQIGASQERQNRISDAAANFEKALALEPDMHEACNYLGYSWADRGINLEKAAALIDKANALSPGNAAYMDSLGWVQYRMGKYEDAVRNLQKAFYLVDDPIISEHLGDAFCKVGRPKAALQVYRRAVWLDGKNSKLREKIRRVRAEVRLKPEQMIDQALSDLDAVGTLTGRLHAFGSSGRKSAAVEGMFFFRKPRRLRVDILGLFSVPEGIVFLEDDRACMAGPDGIVELGVDLRWAYALFDVFSTSRAAQGFRLASSSGGRACFESASQRIYVDEDEIRVGRMEFLENGRVRQRIDIRRYEIKDGLAIPVRIDWNDAAAKQSVSVELRQISVNGPIADDIYDMPGRPSRKK